MEIQLFKNRVIFQFSILLIFLVLLLFVSCLSVKPSTTKSGKNYFETFYVGAEGSQYFIKPFFLKNEDTKEELVIDITFRYKNEIKDSATVNFSIISNNIYKSVDSLKISNKLIVITNSNVDLLFNTKTKKGFKSRFTSEIALDEINKLFNNYDWTFSIYSSNQVLTFKPNKRTEKIITILRDKVFILM